MAKNASVNPKQLNYVLGFIVILMIALFAMSFFRSSDEEELLPTAKDLGVDVVEDESMDEVQIESPQDLVAAGTCQKLYLDSDGDGFGISETDDELCEGDELPLGLSTSGDDCDDLNSKVWRSMEVYEDRDVDGYSSDTKVEICTNNQIPTGYSVIISEILDCNDRSDNVYPGSSWQETVSSLDYDCDGDLDLPTGTIFVSSKKYSGELGGLNGADAKCMQAAANPEGLPLIGDWIAILSSSSIDAIDRLPDAELVDPFGTLIAENKTEFVRKFILSKIEFNEMGDTVSENVWTGTEIDGRFSTELGTSLSTCSDWSTSSARGIMGSSRTTTTSGWLNHDDSNCAEYNALYCVRTA